MSEAENSHNGNGFLIGLVVGGLLGAAAAYILGTEDKDELKKKLKEKGKILLDNLEDMESAIGKKTEGLREKVADQVEIVEEKVKEIPETVDDATKTAKKSFKKFFFRKGRPLVKK